MAAFMSCDEDKIDSAETQKEAILAALGKNSEISDFVDALKQVNFPRDVNSDEITIFAVKNGGGVKSSTAKSTGGEAFNVLRHIVASRITSLTDGLTLAALDGSTLTIKVVGGQVFVNGVPVGSTININANSFAFIVNSILPAQAPTNGGGDTYELGLTAGMELCGCIDEDDEIDMDCYNNWWVRYADYVILPEDADEPTFFDEDFERGFWEGAKDCALDIVEPNDNIVASGETGTLTWTLRGDGSLTFSGTGEMPDYAATTEPLWADQPWVEYRANITTVVIEQGVTTIGARAFRLCTELTSVVIPNSVTSIGMLAFQECSSLTSVTIPNSVTTIGQQAFLLCTALTSIEIPNSVTSIGMLAFQECSSLTSVTIPNSVTTIEAQAFRLCTALTSIEIPNSVTTIGNLAFTHCTALASVTIGNSVTSIGNFAFSDIAITSVTIPASVTTLGNSPFGGNTNLTTISIASGNTSFIVEDGVLFNSGKTVLVLYLAAKTATAYTIPQTVTSIAYGAFFKSHILTSVTIPASVTTIGEWAFDCNNLIEITNHATVPQEIVANTFPNVNISAITLRVPAGSVAAYQGADVWSGFNIVALTNGGGDPPHIPVVEVDFVRPTMTLRLGEKIGLQPGLIPENATYKNVQWHSSDPNVVLVEGDGIVGWLTALSLGQATITVVVDGVSAQSVFTVVPN